MTRTYGRCKRDQRLVASVPHGHWKTTTTFIGALRAEGLTAPAVFDGAINGESFLAYVEQVLVPTLRYGDVTLHPPNRRPGGGPHPIAMAEISMLRGALFGLFGPPCGQATAGQSYRSWPRKNDISERKAKAKCSARCLSRRAHR